LLSRVRYYKLKEKKRKRKTIFKTKRKEKEKKILNNDLAVLPSHDTLLGMVVISVLICVPLATSAQTRLV